MPLILSKKYNMPLFVVCPGFLKSMWDKECKNYNIESIVISYGTLSSTRGNRLSHNFLTRNDYIEDGKYKTKFETTHHFKILVNDGILLVFDEFSKIKNPNTIWSKACIKLTNDVINLGGKSRMLLLSGSPFTNLKHVKILMRLLGFINQSKLYVKNKNKVTLEGLSDLFNECQKLNPSTTSYLKKYLIDNFDKKNIDKVMFSLYVYILKPVISGGMIPPNFDTYQVKIRNRFYELDDENTKRISESLEKIMELIHYNKKENDEEETDYKKDNKTIKLINYNRSICEASKISIPIKELDNNYDLYPNTKFIIGCNYRKNSFDVLENYLKSKYNNVGIINGDVSYGDRNKIIKSFNEPNNNMRILLVMNTII